ncbi:hypothetical protein [Ferroplasma sp.]|jgi:hypothetical protein|uniref:hypothetical protein n=1 Tax=Ferroplasma sp. TaxID=2591003 RepID=UPI002613EA9C|nr:hypothetical protein [Ferroplasma sp.]
MNEYLESNRSIYPLVQLNKIMKRNHKLKINIKELNTDYLIENYEIVKDMEDILLKTFDTNNVHFHADNKNVNIEINMPRITNFFEQFKEYDDTFKSYITQISKLNYKQLKSVYIEFYYQLVSDRINESKTLFEELKTKENLTEKDLLFYTYFNSSINIIKLLINKTEKSSSNNVMLNIFLTSLILLDQNFTILKYSKDNLSRDDLLESLSEINTVVKPYFNITSQEAQDMLFKTRCIMPETPE